jgi:hypothetical protein
MILAEFNLPLATTKFVADYHCENAIPPRRRNIFVSWMDFVAEDSRGFWEDFNAKFIRKLISVFKEGPRGYTEEKDYRSDCGHYLPRGLARCCCDDGDCAVNSED